MALSTSNVSSDYWGKLHVTYGQWTGSAGDASGSINVTGGQVWGAWFQRHDSSGAYLPVTEVSVSGSNPVTVTIYNLAGVTTGRFIIISS